MMHHDHDGSCPSDRLRRGWIGLLILATLMFPELSSAQAVLVRGGLVRSSLTGDAFDEADGPLSDFTGSAHLSLPVSSALSVEFGVGYTRKGGEANDSGVIARVDLDYLEIPALLVAAVEGSSGVAGRVYAGPVMSFETSCSFSEPGFSTDCDDPMFQGELSRHSMDFGILGGVGISVALGGGPSFTLDVAYNRGLRALDDVVDDNSNHNRALILTTGFAFPIGD